MANYRDCIGIFNEALGKASKDLTESEKVDF